jgi:hypothetical protein
MMYGYILLTHRRSLPSTLVKMWTRDRYTHVSVALDDPLCAYSFGRKSKLNFFNGGFVKEDLLSMENKEMQVMILRLPMTKETYHKAQITLAHFQNFCACYHYNFSGIVGFMLHREMNGNNAYFCSQFVSMLLQTSGACSFDKPACFVKPADFLDLKQAEVIFEGALSHYLNLTDTTTADNEAPSVQWA